MITTNKSTDFLDEFQNLKIFCSCLNKKNAKKIYSKILDFESKNRVLISAEQRKIIISWYTTAVSMSQK